MSPAPHVDRQRLATPVPGDEPSGPWLRRDALYSEVQEAVRSDPGDPSYGIPEKQADWEDAARLCLDALATRTKDFYLGTTLLEALVHTSGARGLTEGLWFLAALHEHFWSDFHPRPRDDGTNFDGRLNQLDAFLRSLPRVLESVPMGDARPVLTWGEWRHAGRNLPNGTPSPISPDETTQLAAATSWEFYDDAAHAMREAVAEFERLDDLLDKTYPQGAPSVSETKEKLVELASVLDDLLARKGPGPHRLAAQQVLSQTGAAFLDEEWLSEQMRSGVSLPRALNSIQAACADERAGGFTPEQGWAALLGEAWARDTSYEQRSETPVEPEPSVGGDPPSSQAGPTADTAGGPSAVQAPAPTVMTAAPMRAPVAVAPSGNDPLGALVGACRALRTSDPSQALPYLALRQLRWQDLAGSEPGATLAGPGDGLRRQLGSLFEGQQWPQLLETCEQTLENPSCGAWLDLQRYACAAMRQIGMPYSERPRELVIEALGDMLRRRRWLVEATLGDGSPAADEVTRNWIAAEVLTDAPGASNAGIEKPSAQASSDDPTAAIIARAEEINASEGVEAAVAHLQGAEHESRGGRQRAILSLALADLLLRGGHGDLAVPILESLRETLREACQPARWEAPDFLARTLEALYHGYSSATGLEASEVESRKHAVANELARIDLKRRLRLESR